MLWDSFDDGSKKQDIKDYTLKELPKEILDAMEASEDSLLVEIDNHNYTIHHRLDLEGYVAAYKVEFKNNVYRSTRTGGKYAYEEAKVHYDLDGKPATSELIRTLEIETL